MRRNNMRQARSLFPLRRICAFPKRSPLRWWLRAPTSSTPWWSPTMAANLRQNVVFYENIPANTTFQSIGTVPTGWTCTTPAVNGTTPINCSIASLANAGTATFTVTLKVTAGTAAETVIQNVTSVTSNTTNDPDASNNTSTTTMLVGISGERRPALDSYRLAKSSFRFQHAGLHRLGTKSWSR